MSKDEYIELKKVSYEAIKSVIKNAKPLFRQERDGIVIYLQTSYMLEEILVALLNSKQFKNNGCGTYSFTVEFDLQKYNERLAEKIASQATNNIKAGN